MFGGINFTELRTRSMIKIDEMKQRPENDIPEKNNVRKWYD